MVFPLAEIMRREGYLLAAQTRRHGTKLPARRHAHKIASFIVNRARLDPREFAMNNFNDSLPGTPARDRSERHMEGVRLQGGMFVEAVRVTRMPMMVTDATLPGNPIIFANAAFLELSGYSSNEVLGQDPHFMNGTDT